mmetsp:Transcript_9648/g.23735  ORF Transcript_9648/g.23735 Transcript_9648/m.23735 type:complete len:221 (+) Transcript_9648:1505-2167(+)
MVRLPRATLSSRAIPGVRCKTCCIKQPLLELSSMAKICSRKPALEEYKESDSGAESEDCDSSPSVVIDEDALVVRRLASACSVARARFSPGSSGDVEVFGFWSATSAATMFPRSSHWVSEPGAGASSSDSPAVSVLEVKTAGPPGCNASALSMVPPSPLVELEVVLGEDGAGDRAVGVLKKEAWFISGPRPTPPDTAREEDAAEVPHRIMSDGSVVSKLR